MGQTFKRNDEEINVEESVECLTAGTDVIHESSPAKRNFSERIEEIESFQDRTKSIHLKDELAEKERMIAVEKEQKEKLE